MVEVDGFRGHLIPRVPVTRRELTEATRRRRRDTQKRFPLGLSQADRAVGPPARKMPIPTVPAVRPFCASGEPPERKEKETIEHQRS